MNFANFLLILVQVTINSIAQMLLKKGVTMINFNQSLLSSFFSVATNVYIFSGVTIFVIALVLWLYLLSQFDLSFLYPIGSLAFVITALSGWAFFSEPITLGRGFGIFLILLGVTFIAKS
jgi:drug/metabolite transporter (DMT)-like permease